MTTPFFSVVMPLFNKAHTIAATLDTIARQTYRDFELLIVDDGSTDASVDLVREFGDERVRLLTQDNAGPAAARNTGIAAATGRWTAFLDADDLWHPDHLAHLHEIAEGWPSAGMIGSAFTEIGSPEQFDRLSRPGTQAPRIEAIRFFRRVGEGRPSFFTSSVAVRRAVLQELGGFSDERIGEDRELWARIALRHEIVASERVTVGYMQETGGIMDKARSRWSGKTLSSAADVAPACRVALDAYDTARLEMREDIDLFLDRYVGFAASSGIASGDVELLRQLRPLYRRKPTGKAALYLRLANLPDPLAQPIFYVRAQAARLRERTRARRIGQDA